MHTRIIYTRTRRIVFWGGGGDDTDSRFDGMSFDVLFFLVFVFSYCQQPAAGLYNFNVCTLLLLLVFTY